MVLRGTEVDRRTSITRTLKQIGEQEIAARDLLITRWDQVIRPFPSREPQRNAIRREINHLNAIEYLKKTQETIFKSHTPGTLEWLVYLTESSPSGTRSSPISGARENSWITRCLSFLRSEVRKGAGIVSGTGLKSGCFGSYRTS